MNSKIYKVTPHFSKNALLHPPALHPPAIPPSKGVRGMSLPQYDAPPISKNHPYLKHHGSDK